jgi:predicted esterase
MRTGETRRGAIRQLLYLGGAVAATVVSMGCGLEGRLAAAPLAGVGALVTSQNGSAARLQARPHASAPPLAEAPGLRALGLDAARDALLYVPTGYQVTTPAPLVLSLHGAGGDAQGGLYPLQPLADDGGFLVLAVPSRDRTWDAVLDTFGLDVAFIDQALAWTFARFAVDPASVAVAGFSDGASYALSLGLANGDLFGQVMAFSPGFVAPAPPQEHPRLFISHGTADTVLPIDQCSRRIVPRLERAAYEVTYQEFDGPHTDPPEIARAAVAWFLADRALPPGVASSPAGEAPPQVRTVTVRPGDSLAGIIGATRTSILTATRSQTSGAVKPPSEWATTIRSVRSPIASTTVSAYSDRPAESSSHGGSGTTTS